MFVYTFGAEADGRHESASLRDIVNQRESFFRRTGRKPQLRRITLNAQGEIERIETQVMTIGRQLRWIRASR